MRKTLALILVTLAALSLTACGNKKTLDEQPTQTATSEPTSAPEVTPTKQEQSDIEALFDDVFAPMVNHEKWNTPDILEDTFWKSGYTYLKSNGPSRLGSAYIINSKSGNETYVFINYQKRDTGIETPAYVVFMINGVEKARMANYSSDGSVGADKLLVEGNRVNSTREARDLIFP